MPTKPPNAQLLILFAMILGVGAVGLLTIWMLIAAWRRHERRSSQKPDRPEPRSDLWQAAGDRLSASLNQSWMTQRHGRLEDDLINDDEINEEENEDFDDDDDEHY